MDKNTKNEPWPTEASLLKAMELAWRDHHHARDQTWKTVQMVAVLGVGLLTVDYKYESMLATAFAGVLVALAATFGASITWHHRKLEVRKFTHLMNCEELLGLHRNDIIPLDPGNGSMKEEPQHIQDGAVKVPSMFEKSDIVNPLKNNTALFILRIHLAIIALAGLVLYMRWKT